MARYNMTIGEKCMDEIGYIGKGLATVAYAMVLGIATIVGPIAVAGTSLWAIDKYQKGEPISLQELKKDWNEDRQKMINQEKSLEKRVETK
ncbi:MAG: hypothetical protein Q7R56_03330 [Nanoarchaeota archaeon]|nr:hypothetical protein [Nanoarchaeota archaeon]